MPYFIKFLWGQDFCPSKGFLLNKGRVGKKLCDCKVGENTTIISMKFNVNDINPYIWRIWEEFTKS